MKVSDPKVFFNTIVGTQGLTTTDEITGQLRSIVLSKLSDAIAESKIPALDIASKYDELSAFGKQKLAPEFGAFGLDLSKFFIENVSLPEEVEAAIDQRTKLGVLGDRMGQYTQLQAADAIKIAAANPSGGLAGAGAGLGAGMAIGGVMGQAFQPMMQPQAPAWAAPAPPPAPGAGAPPPPPGAGGPRWSLAIDGKTYGPYTDEALRQMISQGQVAPSTLAWHPGAAGWAPVQTFPGFEGTNPGVAPPPPPPPAR
jgi:hypothetical protein